MSGVAAAEVRLAFPAKPEYLLLARLALVGLGRSLDVDADTVADLKLAITEACGNAVRHAYRDEGGRVSVTFVLDGERLDMIVEDEGTGLLEPFTEEPDAAAVEPLEPPTQGMGIAIIRAVVDELDVGARDGASGTRVRMTKQLDGS